MITDKVRDLAKGKNFAAVTTLRADGAPATQVMWIDCDEEFLLINTEKHRRKFANVQRDPRVTVMIWDVENPYQYVEVRGVVEEIVEGPAARAHIDELAWLYFGRPYDETIIRSERVVLKMRPILTSKNRD